MSLLTDALKRIRSWLESNYEEGATLLPQGLSLSQIEAFAQSLSFELPKEVYELYQWSCGNDSQSSCGNFFDPRDGMGLCSLQRASELASTLNDDEYEDCDIKYLGQFLFPIFEFEGSYLCTVCTLEMQDSSPIVFLSGTTVATVRYVDLTSMMQTVAECFETGVVFRKSAYFDPNVKLLRYDVEKFSPIYRKYNSKLPELSIYEFCREIPELDPESYRLERTLESLSSQAYWCRKVSKA